MLSHQDLLDEHGVLGCALTHLSVWLAISQLDDIAPDTYWIVFEDDVILSEDFMVRWRRTILD